MNKDVVKSYILKLADEVENLRIDALFSDLWDSHKNCKSSTLFLMALSDLERASQTLKLASMEAN